MRLGSWFGALKFLAGILVELDWILLSEVDNTSHFVLLLLLLLLLLSDYCYGYFLLQIVFNVNEFADGRVCLSHRLSSHHIAFV